MSLNRHAIVSELDELLAEWEEIIAQARQRSDASLPHRQISPLSIKMAAAIDRYAPPNTPYRDYGDLKFPDNSMSRLPGHLRALRDDLSKDRLRPVIELIHADLFGDFLEMAQHLLDEGFKDPAAVVAGSTLEEHLRKLAAKHGVPATDANGVFKKASLLNAELKKGDVYSGIDHKSVTAWQGLRNDAAHGNYDAYTIDQVRLMVAGIRDFIVRNPA